MLVVLGKTGRHHISVGDPPPPVGLYGDGYLCGVGGLLPPGREPYTGGQEQFAYVLLWDWLGAGNSFPHPDPSQDVVNCHICLFCSYLIINFNYAGLPSKGKYLAPSEPVSQPE